MTSTVRHDVHAPLDTMTQYGKYVMMLKSLLWRLKNTSWIDVQFRSTLWHKRYVMTSTTFDHTCILNVKCNSCSNLFEELSPIWHFDAVSFPICRRSWVFTLLVTIKIIPGYHQVGTLPPMRVETYIPPEWRWIGNKPPRCGWKPIFHLNWGEPVSAHPNPSGRPIYLTLLSIFR